MSGDIDMSAPNMAEMMKKLKAMQKELNAMATPRVKRGGRKNVLGKAKKAAKVVKNAEEKPKRALSSYNKYMKDALARLKAAEPNMAQKERFRIAVEGWKEENKNKKPSPKKASPAKPKRNRGSLIEIARGLRA